MEDSRYKFRAWDKSRMIYFSDMTIGLEKSKSRKPYVYFSKDTFDGTVRLSGQWLL